MTIRAPLRCLLGSGLLAALTPACGHLTTPVRLAGPTRSTEGVELTVARNSCDQEPEPDWYGRDLTELVVEVRVRNPTAAPIAIHRSEMRLRTADGSALKTLTWGASEPLMVVQGETKSFDLRFMSRESLRCAAALELDTSGSVTADKRVLQTDGITFTPSASPAGAAVSL